MERTVCTRVAAAAIGMAAVALGGLSTGVVGHADTNVPGINSCPTGNVYVFEYNGNGPDSAGSGTAGLVQAVKDADGNTSTTSSSVGDTVVVCPGTYKGVALTIGGPTNATGDESTSSSPTTKDNVTVRSFNGAQNTILVGTGTAPVVTVQANGVTIGGPGLGFTFENPASGAPYSPLVQVGSPGAQSTANEDETTCAAGQTAPGCDGTTPTYVTTNDQVFDNIFSNLVPQAYTPPTNTTVDLKGVELDNTINNTVQQNLFTNAVPDHTTVHSFTAIAVGSNVPTQSPTCTGCGSGFSTNINTALFDNAVQNVFQGGSSSCTTATGFAIDGFVLNAQVYNNIIQQVINNASHCAVSGIESNAFGQLENEQTGTVVPVNGNIDDNTIVQLTANGLATSTGVLLDPQPTQNQAQIAPTGPPTCEVVTTGSCPNYPPSSYTVTDNQLQNLYLGVRDVSLVGQNSYVRENNFQNVVIGVQKDPSTTTTTTTPTSNALDATNNYWGCDDGPVATDDGGCARASGDVAYNPWLGSPVQQAGDEAGQNAGH